MEEHDDAFSHSEHSEHSKYKGTFKQKGSLIIHESNENSKKFKAHLHTE